MRRLALPAVLLLALTASAAPVPKDVKNPPFDPKALLGTWEAVTQDDGHGLKAIKTKFSHDLVITEDRVKLHALGCPEIHFEYDLDAKAEPPHFDWFQQDREHLHRCIVRLRGDTLENCSALGDAPHPTEFKGGKDQVLTVSNG